MSSATARRRCRFAWIGTALLALAAFVPAQASDYQPDVTFKLETGIGQGKMIFTGVGGGIDGLVNPTLEIEPGQVVQITLVNGDGALHDIVVPELDARSDQIAGKGSSSVIVFRAEEAGEYLYLCSVPGHQAAGVEGMI